MTYMTTDTCIYVHEDMIEQVAAASHRLCGNIGTLLNFTVFQSLISPQSLDVSSWKLYE